MLAPRNTIFPGAPEDGERMVNGWRPRQWQDSGYRVCRPVSGTGKAGNTRRYEIGLISYEARHSSNLQQV